MKQVNLYLYIYLDQKILNINVLATKMCIAPAAFTTDIEKRTFELLHCMCLSLFRIVDKHESMLCFTNCDIISLFCATYYKLK